MATSTPRHVSTSSRGDSADSSAGSGKRLAGAQVIEEVDESGARIGTFVLGKDGVVAKEQRGETMQTATGVNGSLFRLWSMQEIGLLLWRQISAVFLPAGYPHSVTEDYLEYQIFDSLQAFASSIAGLLSSRAVLEGVGVGDAAANPTTALLLSVLQDSVGRLATILFAHRLGTSLEPECKAYRLAADIFNDAAMILDCLSPVFPKPIRVAVLSASSVLRALCGVAAGSAKASLSAHFAKRGNLGEVNAKDSSQETIISLAGMLAGTVVVSHVTTPLATWFSLLSLLALHLYLNYRAVRAVHMTTLNRQRASIVFSVLQTRLLAPQAPEAAPLALLSPRAVAQTEWIFVMDGELCYYHPLPASTSLKPHIHRHAQLGVPLARLIRAVERVEPASIAELMGVFADERYLVWLDPHDNVVLICVKEGADARDLLKAWAVAFHLASYPGHIMGKHWTEAVKGHGQVLREVNEVWNEWAQELERAGWDLSISSLETGKARRLRLRKDE